MPKNHILHCVFTEFLLISRSDKQEIKLQQPYKIKSSKTTLPSTVTVKVTIVFPAALVAVTVNVSLSAGVTVLSCKVDKTEPDMTGNVPLLVMVTPPTPSVSVVLPCIQEMSMRGRLKSEMETDKVRVSPASNIGEATCSAASITVGVTAVNSKGY